MSCHFYDNKAYFRLQSLMEICLHSMLFFVTTSHQSVKIRTFTRSFLYFQSQFSGSQENRGSRDSLLDHSMDSEEGLDDLPSPDNVKGGKKKVKQDKAKKGNCVMT